MLVYRISSGIYLLRTRHLNSGRSTIATRRGCKSNYLRCGLNSHSLGRYNPISLEAFDSQVYTQFYDPNAGRPSDDPLVSHRLSLMFMVLAIGSLMNTTIPAYSLEAEKYHCLARAALFHNSIFDEPTINAVQALVRLF